MTPRSSTAGDEEVFKASHEWFKRFKRKTKIHIVMRYGKVTTNSDQRYQRTSSSTSRHS